MSNLVIVAVPSEDDYVWKVSSEKVPHMTILFLGETESVGNFAKIADFVRHATDTSLKRFGMEVDRRGTLGVDEADVLFFSKTKWSGYEDVAAYRSFLLQDENIRKAYDSVEQFEGFTPHLTLGYAETPAKPDTRDYPGFSYVSFDKIALWFGDYEGFEYPLKSYDWDMEVAMGGLTTDIGWIKTAQILHYGVKGMRWGVRKSEGSPTAVTVTQKGKKLKTKGGEHRPAAKEAIRVAEIGQIRKKSGVAALTNEELQAYQTRVNLEQNVKRLNYTQQNAAKKFVLSLLGQTGKNAATQAANEVASQQVKKALAKKLVKTAATAAVVA